MAAAKKKTPKQTPRSELRMTIDELLADLRGHPDWRALPLSPTSKKPMIKGWLRRASADESLLVYWADRDYDFAWHLVACGLLVIDLDWDRVSPAIIETASKMVADLKTAAGGCWARTPSGGWHFYFRAPLDVPAGRNLYRALGHAEPWIESKCAGQHITAYRRDDPAAHPRPVPDWLLDLLDTAAQGKRQTPSKAQLLDRADAELKAAPEGARNTTLYSVSLQAGRLGATPDEVRARLTPTALAAGLDAEETDRTISSAVGTGKQAAPRSASLHAQLGRALPQTELIFAAQPGGSNLGRPRGGWVVWTPRGWVDAPDGAIARRALELAAADKPAASSSALEREAKSAESLLALERASGATWDTDPRYLLDAAGCAVQISTAATAGQTLEPDPRIRSRRRLGVKCDMKAAAPVWSSCVDSWSDGRPELSSYLRRLAGYSLLAGNPEHAFIFFAGSGANGKSSFLHALRAIIGDYSVVISADAFLADSRREARTDLYRLEGRRLAILEELPGKKKWDVAKLKAISGDTEIEVRQLYRDPWQMKIMALLIAQGNERPRYDDASSGWTRRVQVVPWDWTVPQGKRELNLGERLVALEGPGILTWMLQGLREWHEQGLNPPGEVVATTQDYIDAHGSSVSSFVRQCLAPRARSSAQPGSSMSDVRIAWRDWRVASGDGELEDRPPTASWLRRELQSAGVSCARTGGASGTQLQLLSHRLRDDRPGQSGASGVIDQIMTSMPPDNSPAPAGQKDGDWSFGREE